MTERFSCSCKSCQSACTKKPGWLKYGEEKIIADYLNISIKELFDKYLLVDWHETQDSKGNLHDYFLLSPCVTTQKPGGQFPFDPRGQCVFFKDGLCSIHAVAPFECQKLDHTTDRNVSINNHLTAARSWDNADAQRDIEILLGNKPTVPHPTTADLLEFYLSPHLQSDFISYQAFLANEKKNQKENQ